MKKLSIMVVLMAVLLTTLVAANPLLDPVSDVTVTANTNINFAVASSAADNGTVDIAINDSAFNSRWTYTSGATSGTFDWTPGDADVGVYSLKFTASDDNSSDEESFVITVNAVAEKLTSDSSVLIGGPNQERSNPNHDDEDNENINATVTVTLKNDGSSPITDLAGTFSLSGFTQNDLQPSVKFSETSIAVGASVTATVEMRVPEELDAVDAEGRPVSPTVATLTFTGLSNSKNVSDATTVQMQAENKLTFKDKDVRIDGEKDSIRDGETVSDEAKPESTLEFIFEVENEFNDNEDVEIEDVEIEVNMDNELGDDEDDNLGDLGPEDEETLTINGEVDEDADDGRYDVEAVLTGKDEFDARHGERLDFRIEVDRKTHDLNIRSLTLSPERVSCEDFSTLRVSLRNIGSRDEDESYVTVEVENGNFGEISEEFEIEEDDSETISFEIPTEDLDEGRYRVLVKTLYDTSKESDSDTIFLTKAECGSDDEPSTPPPPPPSVVEPEDVDVVEVPSGENTQPTGNVVAEPTQEGDFTQSNAYIALIIALYIIVIAGGVLLVYKLVKK